MTTPQYPGYPDDGSQSGGVPQGAGAPGYGAQPGYDPQAGGAPGYGPPPGYGPQPGMGAGGGVPPYPGGVMGGVPMSVGDGLSWAWSKFKGNALILVVGFGVWTVLANLGFDSRVDLN